MPRASKIGASKLPYQSVSQLTLSGFDTPFAQHLNPENRWVVLAHRIPWDDIVSVYNKQMHNGETGASNINGRVVIGSLVIKHLCNLSDDETILQIQENMSVYFQQSEIQSFCIFNKSSDLCSFFPLNILTVAGFFSKYFRIASTSANPSSLVFQNPTLNLHLI